MLSSNNKQMHSEKIPNTVMPAHLPNPRKIWSKGVWSRMNDGDQRGSLTHILGKGVKISLVKCSSPKVRRKSRPSLIRCKTIAEFRGIDLSRLKGHISNNTQNLDIGPEHSVIIPNKEPIDDGSMNMSPADATLTDNDESISMMEDDKNK